MPKIHLLLLDDHALFRVMLGRLLDTDSEFQVIADCSAIPDALEILANQHVDLVLLDYDLGKRETGFQFIKLARNSGYPGRIFIVTAGMADSDYLSALGQGVCGIFLKHSSPELLVEAIHKVIAGQTSIDPQVINSLAQSLTGEGNQVRSNELTERERQVLKGVFGGLSNKQIGSLLNISEATVKSALQQLFAKTGVRTRSQLVRVALEEYGAIWGLRPPS
jgi:DNA-binding NarL/FixJ family response regulator